MANTTISPNMALPIPVVGVDPGPDWANDLNACLEVVDGHNHSSGNGVQITPSGLSINTDLPFNNNNATTLRSARFSSQASPISQSTDVGCLYESGVDLFYNDGNGNQIRLTQAGAISGAAGTITGLPSGTASASFSGATFTFQSATSTPAAMNFGPITVGNNVASSKAVTIAPNSSIASNYNLTLPAALPGATDYTTLDSSGNLSFNTSGSTGTGAVVLAASPTFSGTVSGVLSGGTYVPTLSFTGGARTINSTAAYVTRLNDIVSVKVQVFLTTTTGSNAAFVSITLPIATAALAVSGVVSFIQTGENTASTQMLTNSGTTLVIPFVADFGSQILMGGNSNGVLNFDFTYQIT